MTAFNALSDILFTSIITLLSESVPNLYFLIQYLHYNTNFSKQVDYTCKNVGLGHYRVKHLHVYNTKFSKGVLCAMYVRYSGEVGC